MTVTSAISTSTTSTSMSLSATKPTDDTTPSMTTQSSATLSTPTIISPTTDFTTSPTFTDEPVSPHKLLTRPSLNGRKSSGTLIIARDDPRVEIKEGEETFDADDARAMSPRRNSEDLEKMSQDARAELSQHAKHLHDSLLQIFNRIEAVKEEHDKLDSNNKFLQKYIGDLMSTSKITATGAGGSASTTSGAGSSSGRRK